MFGLGISYTSATLASATTSMTPMITFFLSTLMRIETVSLKRASGIAKLAGVAVCTGGALTIAFYKGPSLKSFNHHYISSHHNNNRSTTHATKTWIEGAFLMILCAISWAIWLVFQGNVMKEYPSKLLFSTVLTLCTVVQSLVVALIFEREYGRWMLSFNIDLLAVAFSGIMVSSVALYLQSWCIAKRGQVFFAISMPLSFIITIVGSFLALGESIDLGSVLAGVLMAGGLYSVLWGKNRDQGDCKSMSQDTEECVEEKEKVVSP